MDRFRGRIGRKGGGSKESVPTIVIDSPPEEINVPYADSSSPSTSTYEGTAPIALPEEPVIEVVVEGPEARRQENDEMSKPESADPAGENAQLLDDDDDEEAPKKQRRQSLRRNSISLPNLDSLELQDIKGGVKGQVSDFSNSDNEEMSEDELLSTTGQEYPSKKGYVRRKSVSSPKMLKPPGDEENGSHSNANSITSINSLASLLREKLAMIPVVKMKSPPSTSYKVKIWCLILFLTVAWLIGSAHYIYYQKVLKKPYYDRVNFNKIKRDMRIHNAEGSEIIHSRLGVSLNYDKVFPCLPEDDRGDGSTCLEWMNRARMYLDHYSLYEDMKCYNVEWFALSDSVPLKDCFDLSNAHWYGGGQTADPAWPLEKTTQAMSPFITGRIEKHKWGNVLKRYFINSKGAAIIIENSNPLYISVNESNSKELCLMAKYDDFAYVNRVTPHAHLNYSICTTLNANVTKVHSYLTEKALWDGLKQSDIGIIHSLLTEPLWEITAASKAEFTEGTVSNYTNNVISLGFLKQGHVLINEFWQKNIGDFTIDEERFELLEETINIMHRRGFRIVFTVQPFISTESQNFAEAVSEGLLVSERSSDRRIPALTRYKSLHSAGVLDVTNNRTIPWLLEKLKDVMSKYQIDAFNLDFATAYSMPHYYQCENRIQNPDQYKSIFINSVQGSIPVFSVNSAIERPRAPTFVSLPQFESSWEGLRRVIPTVLTYGLIGYPFLIPGAVGGDYEAPDSWSNKSISYEDDVLLPDKELYIRWLQLATFLPVIRFTHLPSTYGDDNVLEMAKVLTNLRQNLVTPLLKEYASDALDSGFPLIRPLWMLDSNDPSCHMVTDQFSVGNELIVAPVLHSGIRQREVYLPAGVWKDGIDGSLRKGSRWIHDYRVEEDEVAYFKKMPLDTRL